MNKIYSLKIVRIFLLFLFLAIFVGVFPLSAFAAEDAQPDKVIRVGFPTQIGLSEHDSEGNPTGYTYEYLQEIAQYTGWEYEFVSFPGELNEVLSKMFTMLQDGELDLMGAMSFDDNLAKIFEYPTYHYGVTYTNISVLKTNTTITEKNFQALDSISIAVMEAANQHTMTALKEFCLLNGVELNLVICKTAQEYEQVLHSGQVDATITSDLDSDKDLFRVIAKFAPKQFYFASTKGNTELVKEIDDAIMHINEADPYITSKLYDKYLYNTGTGLQLNTEEEEYIDSQSSLQVAVFSNRAPIQSYNPETNTFEGISVDYVKYFAEKTGFDVHFIEAKDEEHLKELIQQNKVDLVAGVFYDYKFSHNFNISLTQPYTSSQTIMATNNVPSSYDLSDKRLVLPKSFSYINFTSDENVLWVENEEECLQAIRENKADYSYGNGYVIQYYANQFSLKNISLIPQSTKTQDICVGVVRPIDKPLLSILNKVANNLDENDIRSIVYRNTLQPAGNIPLSAFIDSNPREAMILVILFSLIVLGLMGAVFYNRVHGIQMLNLENERYEQLCELSNEYLFEYNYLKDLMHFAGRSSSFLGKERLIPQFSKTIGTSVVHNTSVLFPIWEHICSKKSGSSEILCKLDDNTSHWLKLTAKVIHGADGSPIYFIGKVADIQKEKEETDLLKQQAQCDSLTGIYNAATIRLMTSKTLDSASPDEKNVLIIIDVDHFKDVNDKHGHYTGDQVLICTAEILQSTFRTSDIIGRLGGDEFVVFMRNVKNHNVVATKCASLLQEVSEINKERFGFPVSLSIGAALAERDQDYDSLYQKADKALYAVKNKGRNNYSIDPKSF